MSRRETIVLALLTAIAVVPFWSGALLLATDLPQHLAAAAIARDYPARGLDLAYAVDLSPRPYLGTTYLLWALGADLLAARIALSLYAIALVLAVRVLVRSAPDRDPRLVYFAPLFIASWPCAYGFLPFIFGLPPAIAAIAYAEKKPLVLLFALHLTALLFHPLAFAAGVIGSLAFARTRPRLLIPIAIAALFIFAPAPETAIITSDDAIATDWRFQIKHQLLDFAFAYLPGPWDTVAIVPTAAALVWMFALRLRDRVKLDAHDLAAIALFAVYLFAPGNLAIGAHRISLLGPRWVIIVWIGGLLFARRAPRLAPWAPIASAIALAVMLAIGAHRFGERWGPEVEAAIARLPEQAAFEIELAPPADPPVNVKLLAPPQEHLHAYAMLKRARYDGALFSTRQNAVQLRARPLAELRWTQTATGVRIEDAAP